MYDVLPAICWYMCEAWQDVRFVVGDLLVPYLLSVICWYVCEAW